MSRPGKGADPAAYAAACVALEAKAPVERFLELAEPSRAARRGVAAALEVAEALSVREALARHAGADCSEKDPAERLLRRAAGREAPSRQRSNPIVRSEAFRCLHCEFDVPLEHGGHVRNHCPRCLRSLHVDGSVPGDRASACGGLMDPTSPEFKGGVWRVTHRCRRCAFTRRNRLYPDWKVEPDCLDPIRPSGGAGPASS